MFALHSLAKQNFFGSIHLYFNILCNRMEAFCSQVQGKRCRMLNIQLMIKHPLIEYHLSISHYFIQEAYRECYWWKMPAEGWEVIAISLPLLLVVKMRQVSGLSDPNKIKPCLEGRGIYLESLIRVLWLLTTLNSPNLQQLPLVNTGFDVVHNELAAEINCNQIRTWGPDITLPIFADENLPTVHKKCPSGWLSKGGTEWQAYWEFLARRLPSIMDLGPGSLPVCLHTNPQLS